MGEITRVILSKQDQFKCKVFIFYFIDIMRLKVYSNLTYDRKYSLVSQNFVLSHKRARQSFLKLSDSIEKTLEVELKTK